MKDLTPEDIKIWLSSLKQNSKAVIAIVAVLFVLDGVFLLRAQFISVGRLFGEAGKLKKTITTARNDAKFISTYQKRVADLRNELSLFSKMTVNEENLPVVIESISKFADLSAVRILRIKPMADTGTGQKTQGRVAVKGKETYARQKISITTKCGFHQLGRFIALAESSPVFLEVRSIEIQTDPQEFFKQQVTIVLETVVRKT